MPMYEYLCKKCAKEVTVLRSFKDYEAIPNSEDEDLGTECEHDWERTIGGNQTLQKAPGWGGKGYW